MARRLLSTVMVAAALCAASGAWTGWVFLHTIGDPARARDVAKAVLSDPSARHEIAGAVANGLAGAANTALSGVAGGGVAFHVDGNDPAVRQAAEAVLANPQFTAVLSDAV